ncbi:MAG: type VI secretion system-associated protein TagF [Pseudomonadota bacterium]|nr:type VI secretion system-associated protein TagF [Pseudomonadota bacterium]
MPAGFFGKLPAKRDFVAQGASRAFLETWEPWLQASLATSRQLLGADWAAAYNRAPIWRFWLGAHFAGEAIVGALMACVDGVGRPFPLAVFAGEGDGLLPPPEIEANDAWCEAAEAALLLALAPETAFEDFARAVEALPSPALQTRVEEISGVEQLAENVVLVRGLDAQPSLAFRAARRFGHRGAFAGQSFWWTVGGEGYGALALAVVGLPAPALFADMLTGVFAKGAPADG